MSFFCRGLGSPTPQLTWLRNSDTISSSKRVFIDTEAGVLRLFLVTTDDVATYTCVYKNKYGDARKSAALIVDGVNPGQCKCGREGSLGSAECSSLTWGQERLEATTATQREHRKRGEGGGGGGGSTTIALHVP